LSRASPPTPTMSNPPDFLTILKSQITAFLSLGAAHVGQFRALEPTWLPHRFLSRDSEIRQTLPMLMLDGRQLRFVPRQFTLGLCFVVDHGHLYFFSRHSYCITINTIPLYPSSGGHRNLVQRVTTAMRKPFRWPPVCGMNIGVGRSWPCPFPLL
jgi:hypothetical protein